MSFNGQLLASGGVAQCLTDSVQLFGADGTYSSNIAVYQFNGNSNDATGNYNATAQGSPTYVTGKFGQAASLSNSDTDYFTTSISPTILGNSFSLSAWVYVTQDSVGSDYYSIAGAYWNGTSGQQSWVLYILNGTLKFFSNLGPTSGSGSVYFGSNTVPLNTWTFVGFSVDDKNEISLYLNDQVETSSVTQSLRPNSINLTIGNIGPYNASRTFYGLLDQVRVFDRQLSQAEFYTLYNETDSTTSNTNLLNDGAGASLYGFNYDASDAGQLYDGVSSNVNFGVGGQINTAVRFNGGNSQITIPDAGIGNNTTARLTFSVSIWVKTTSTSAAAIVSDYDGADYAFYLQMNADGTLNMGNYFDGVGSFTSGTATINDGNWHNLVLINNTSDNTQKLFVDANNTPDINQTLTSGTKNEVDVQVGYYASAGGYVFDGDIDQLRFFTIALSTNQMDTIYAEQACVYTCTTDTVNYPTTNLAYYKLDNSADDETGLYDGTSVDVFYTFGRYAQAAIFNGSSSIIALPSSSPFGDDDTIKSISAWVKLTTTSSKGIVYTVSSSTNLSDYFTMQIRGDLSMVYIAARNGSSSNQYQTITSITLDTNWHHYVFQLGTSSREIYIDGVKQTVTDTNSGSATSTSWISYPSYDNTIHSDIGLGRRSSAYYSDMNLDQVRMFGSALTLTQVSELYNEKPCADTSDFKTVLYYGNGDTTYNTYISNVAIDLETNGGLVWVKALTAYNHLWMDSVRGTTSITSNDTTQARTNYNRFQSYEANGFMILANNAADLYKINRVSNEFVSWVWKGGGDAVSNTNGTITSQVSANAAAGFSICKWTGTGVDGKTIGHGLGAAPELIITKGLSNATSWVVGIGGVSGLSVNDYLTFTTNVKLSSTTFYQAYSTDTFQVGVSSANEMNKSASNDYISYCFRSISGYSKIGTYEGNGNTATTTITTDFEPSWVMIKRTDSANNWVIFDNKRDTTSPLSKILYADLDDSEAEGGTTTSITISSTGFSMSTSQFGGSINADGGQYLYMAFK